MPLITLLACYVAVPPASSAPEAAVPATLVAARAAVRTGVYQTGDGTPAPTPPAHDLELVHYAAPLGQSVAYVTPIRDGAKLPAVLWIQGGFSWGVDQSAWTAGPRDNDQSATGIRRAGIAQMYASLLGRPRWCAWRAGRRG
jgi:hypothetical protein